MGWIAAADCARPHQPQSTADTPTHLSQRGHNVPPCAAMELQGELLNSGDRGAASPRTHAHTCIAQARASRLHLHLLLAVGMSLSSAYDRHASSSTETSCIGDVAAASQCVKWRCDARCREGAAVSRTSCRRAVSQMLGISSAIPCWCQPWALQITCKSACKELPSTAGKQARLGLLAPAAGCLAGYGQGNSVSSSARSTQGLLYMLCYCCCGAQLSHARLNRLVRARLGAAARGAADVCQGHPATGKRHCTAQDCSQQARLLGRT